MARVELAGMLTQTLLPTTDLSVSSLCFGVAAFGTGAHGAQADALLSQFIEAGGNFLDTAHCYAFWAPGGLGASERELGASLRRLGVRDRVVIATKGGHSEGGPDYPRPADFLSEAVLSRDLDESLERLGLDSVDLYYLHRDDGRTPVAAVVAWLNREIQRGRIRYAGASNWSVARIAEANAWAAQAGLQGFVTSQVQWSLADPDWTAGEEPTMRSVTAEELPWHTATQMPVVAYSATANGYFARDPQGRGSAINRARWERARLLAARIGCTPTQIALSYLRHQPFPVIPLFSTLNPDHLAEALGSVNVALDAEEVRSLRDGETD